MKLLFKAGSILIAVVLATIPSQHVDAQESTNVEVLKTFGYLDRGSQYVVLGEVMNGEAPVQFVEVIVDLFDQDRNQLTSLSGSVALERLDPRQISPFAIVLKDEELAPLVKSFSVNIGKFSPADEKPRVLDVVFHEMETSEDDIIISGRVVNDGTSISENTRVVVVLYNAIGEPLRLASQFTEPKDVFPLSSGTFATRIKIEDINVVTGYTINSESTQYAETERISEVRPETLERLEETVRLNEFSVNDAMNRRVSGIRVGEPALFKISVTSNALERQQYMYILQIKDENDFVVSISWLIDHLDVKESSEASIAWIPLEGGNYKVEAFVWNNLEEAVPLSFGSLSQTFTAR